MGACAGQTNNYLTMLSSILAFCVTFGTVTLVSLPAYAARKTVSRSAPDAYARLTDIIFIGIMLVIWWASVRHQLPELGLICIGALNGVLLGFRLNTIGGQSNRLSFSRQLVELLPAAVGLFLIVSAIKSGCETNLVLHAKLCESVAQVGLDTGTSKKIFYFLLFSECTTREQCSKELTR